MGLRPRFPAADLKKGGEIPVPELSPRATKSWVDRRQFLVGSVSLAGVAASWVPVRAQARPQAFRHGDFEITVLSDGHLELPAAVHGLDAPPEEVRRLLQESGLDPEQLRPAANPALIRTGSDFILVDTGSGQSFQPTVGKLLDNLAAAGVDPGEITKVVFTHAHPDHIWGTTGADGVLHFPNAHYYVSSAEWDFWMKPDLMTSMPQELHGFIDGARTNLAAVEDRVTMVGPGDEITAGISVIDSAGHTPGHISLFVEGNEGLLIPADAITEPAIYFPHPEWRFAFDMDADLAAANRTRMLDQAATDRVKMLGFHWPYPGLGFAERQGTAYSYVPAA